MVRGSIHLIALEDVGIFYLQAPLKKSQKLSNVYFVFKAGWDCQTSPRAAGTKSQLVLKYFGVLRPFWELKKGNKQIIKVSLKFSKGIFSRESGCPESLKGEHERHVIIDLFWLKEAVFFLFTINLTFWCRLWKVAVSIPWAGNYLEKKENILQRQSLNKCQWRTQWVYQNHCHKQGGRKCTKRLRCFIDSEGSHQ